MLQSGTPQTHTTGSGHRSSRLVYLTLYFHAISASTGLRVVVENLEFHLNSWQYSARVVKNTSVTECAVTVTTVQKWTVDFVPSVIGSDSLAACNSLDVIDQL
jgi:hypothetical protein